MIDKHYATLTPAYGRDYSSIAEIKRDFFSGKDFVLQDVQSKYYGKPCNILDFKPGTKVRIRYRKLSSVAIVEVPAKEETQKYLEQTYQQYQTRY